MSVQAEYVPGEDLDGLLKVSILRANRRQSGDWVLRMLLEFDLTLPDGRRLRGMRETNMSNIAQVGRRQSSRQAGHSDSSSTSSL